jgi:hypothetical protein
MPLDPSGTWPGPAGGARTRRSWPTRVRPSADSKAQLGQRPDGGFLHTRASVDNRVDVPLRCGPSSPTRAARYEHAGTIKKIGKSDPGASGR